MKRKATPLLAVLGLCAALVGGPALGAGGRAPAARRAAAPGYTVDATETVAGTEMQAITYRSDGLNVKAYLFLARGTGRRPGVVFSHGGVSGVSKDMVRRSADLANAGYMVITPAYRGEGGSEGRVEVAAGEIDDVLAAAELLRRHPRVDPKRVALVGSSHGALISVLGAARDGRFAAVAEACGVMDVHAWYRYLVDNGFDVSDSLSVAVYGRGPEDKPEAFERRNALRVIKDLRTPLLIQQGLKDRTVPPDQAYRLAAALDRAGNRAYELQTYPLLAHAFWFWDNPRSHTPAELEQAEASWQDLLGFLARNLGNADADAAAAPPPPTFSTPDSSGGNGYTVKQMHPEAYRAEIEEWRRNRVSRLKADNGWLAVAGLYWLKPGANRMGTGPDNDIILPAGSAPSVVGTVTLGTDGRVSLDVLSNVAVAWNGQPVRRMTLTSDDNGGTPEVLALNDLRFFLIKRTKGFAIRLRDLNAPGRRAFSGIESFPIDTTWRCEARFVPYDPPRQVEIASVIGTVDTMLSPGYAEFTRDGQAWRLDAILESPTDTEYFFIFKDGTSGTETYPPGRFLYSDLPVEGRLVLDFNRAYNPPCAFTDFATCPLPPPQNALTLRVTAGEKKYGHH